MNTTIYNYNGQNVTFRDDNGMFYVNATEMSAQFGKRPTDWLENQGTRNFLAELSKVRKSTLDDLVIVTKGGNTSGTWMHEDVAMEFSRWLSPSFSIWCNDRIKELLKHGATALEPDRLLDPDFIINLAMQLKIERQQKMIALHQVKELSAKGQDFDAFTSDTGLFTMSEAAKLLFGDKGRNKLYNLLRDDGIIFKNSTEPKQEYVTRGYFRIREVPVTINGKTEYKPQTMVTNLGLSWLRRRYVTRELV